MVVEFAIDKFLKKRIDLMIKRVTDSDENDNYLIIEGDTGSGKTNMSVGIAYLVSQQTGRVFDNSRIFFDTAAAVKFAKETREQIIIFDEPAFGGLKAEWRKKTQIDLIKLLYTARIKRHFVIFNLVKFSKFNDDIIEKAIALIRIYKLSESKKKRGFLYIPKRKLAHLLDYWHKKHFRAYNSYSVYRGSVFRYVLPEIINREEYNKVKEASISTIGEEDKHSKKEKLLQSKIAVGFKKLKEKYPDLKLADYCNMMGISSGTPSKWNENSKKEGITLEMTAEKVEIPELIINNDPPQVIKP